MPRRRFFQEPVGGWQAHPERKRKNPDKPIGTEPARHYRRKLRERWLLYAMRGGELDYKHWRPEALAEDAAAAARWNSPPQGLQTQSLQEQEDSAADSSSWRRRKQQPQARQEQEAAAGGSSSSQPQRQQPQILREPQVREEPPWRTRDVETERSPGRAGTDAESPLTPVSASEEELGSPVTPPDSPKVLGATPKAVPRPSTSVAFAAAQRGSAAAFQF